MCVYIYILYVYIYTHTMYIYMICIYIYMSYTYTTFTNVTVNIFMYWWFDDFTHILILLIVLLYRRLVWIIGAINITVFLYIGMMCFNLLIIHSFTWFYGSSIHLTYRNPCNGIHDMCLTLRFPLYSLRPVGLVPHQRKP